MVVDAEPIEASGQGDTADASADDGYLEVVLH